MPHSSDNEVREVILRDEFVELNKLLKFENLVLSGGEAKTVIASGLVSVDGVTENRVRRKLYAGSQVTFSGITLQIRAKD